MRFRRIFAHILAARAVEAEPGIDKTEHLTLDNNPAKGFTDARGEPAGTGRTGLSSRTTCGTPENQNNEQHFLL